MKKYLAVVLALCLLLCVCACSGSKSADTEQNSSVDKYSHINEDTLDLYIGGATANPADSSQAESITTAASFIDRNAEEYGITDFVGYQNIYSDSAPETKTINVLGRDLECHYTGSHIYSTTADESVHNKRFDNYNYFSDSGENIYVKYCADTNMVEDYSRYSSEIEPWKEGDPLLSETEINTIAENFFLSVIPKEEFAQYKQRNIVYPPSNLGEMYVVYYRRYYEGYMTDEVIYVTISQNKKIQSYCIMDHGRYENVVNKIEKEHIEAVETALRSKLESTLDGASISDGMLVTDVYGGMYVRVDVSYPAYPSFYHIDFVYAKII